jgi:hypothetical protein
LPHTVMRARRMLLALGCTASMAAAPAAAAEGATMTASPSLVSAASAPANTLQKRVDAAFIASFPLYEMARARFNAAINPLNPHPFPPNGEPARRRTLIDHSSRDVTTPNNDTLYLATWLDLKNTPVRMQVPRVDGARYYSIALLDIFSNNFAVLGRQHDGDGPIDLVLVGPAWTAPLPAGRVMRAPSNDVQVVGRFLVDGSADLPAVRQLLDATNFTPLVAGAQPVPQRVPVTASTDPANYLAVVNEMLARNPVPAAEAAAFAGWADLGLGGGADAFERASPEVQAAWRARLPVLHEALKVGLRHGTRQVSGWGLPAPQVGNFGTDTNLRAAVAFGGLSALPSTEAIYLNLETGPSGRSLDGAQRWKLLVPPLQVKGFWSLSMYEKDADGRLFFTDNPLKRYSIGDRTPGLQRRGDGSVEVLLQHDAPADTRNWLPTPKGAYAITLRAYLPSEALRRGEAPLPRLLPED